MKLGHQPTFGAFIFKSELNQKIDTDAALRFATKNMEIIKKLESLDYDLSLDTTSEKSEQGEDQVVLSLISQRTGKPLALQDSIDEEASKTETLIPISKFSTSSLKTAVEDLFNQVGTFWHNLYLSE